jgi:hypothetical protein
MPVARLLEFAYQLRRHRLGDWGLDRWGMTLAWGASVVILVQWLLRGRPVLPVWHWLILTLLILGGLGLLLLRKWAARRLYVEFEPQPRLVPPPGKALMPEDKIPLRATGRFEVNGRARVFADLTAYWRTYASREHALLAIQHRTRFLLAYSPGEDVGMWYIFIRPDAVKGIVPGNLCYGGRSSPALRVAYRHQPPTVEGKRPPKPIVATAYLAFDDDVAREQVWADLAMDREPEATRTV